MNDEKNESVRFTAEFQLQGQEDVIPLPIVRPGKFLKMWRKAATKVAAFSGATMLSDDRLNEYLIKVGRYFGRDAGKWTPEGDPTIEVVEENGRRIVRRTATFVGWKLQLKLKNPFYDERLAAETEGAPPAASGAEDTADRDEYDDPEDAPPGRGSQVATDMTPAVVQSLALSDSGTVGEIYNYRRDYVDVTSDKTWRAIIMDQPWAPAERRKRFCSLLESKCRSQDPFLQLEGLHGLWEFIVNRDYHQDMSAEQLSLVVQSVVHDDIHCAIVAAAAVWSLVSVADSRRKATELGALELLLQGARRSLKWDVEEELRHQYQTCVFGALSVMFVDRFCRDRYRDVEPTFETLFAFCDVHEGAAEHFEADRRSFAARVLCMMAHRDSEIRKGLVQFNCVEKILELTHTEGPGSNHVDLCMMTIIAVLVLDEGVMELLRMKNMAPMVFEACVKQLGDCIDMLDPDSGRTAIGIDKKLIIAMAECSAQGMWGACYECCLPQGGGVQSEYVRTLSRVGNRCVDLASMGLGKVVRCISASIANMCFDFDLSKAVMDGSEPLPPPPPKRKKRGSVCISDDGLSASTSEESLPDPEAIAAREREEQDRVRRSGVGFLVRCLNEHARLPAEEEPHVRVSACVGLAALAGHDFAAKGDACLVGPHRPGLIRLGGFQSLLEAVYRPLRVEDEQLTIYCQVSSAYAVLQLSTMIGRVDPKSLMLLVTLMKQNTKNVEMVEYLMAAIWILLRNPDNRHVLMTNLDNYLGGKGPEVEVMDGGAAEPEDFGMSQVAQIMPVPGGEDGEEAKIVTGQIKDASVVSHVEEKMGGDLKQLSRVLAPSDLGLDLEEEHPGGKSELSLQRVEEDGQFSEQFPDDYPARPLTRSKTITKDGSSLNPEDGSEWGLAIIVSVGNNWIEKLLGSEGAESVDDMDAPLVKLFEFLVSALCLLIAQNMGQDGEVLEATEETIYEQAGDGSFWGVRLRPPTPNFTLSRALNGAVDLLVKLMALRATVASKIIQLSSAALWNLCKIDVASQRYMLMSGLAQHLVEIPACTLFPPLVRANCCMLLAVVAENYGNLDFIPGGIQSVVDVAIGAINTKIPVLEQRGAIVLARLGYRPPQGAEDPRAHLMENKEMMSRSGGIRSLLAMIRHTHQRVVNLESRALREQLGKAQVTAKSRAKAALFAAKSFSEAVPEEVYEEPVKAPVPRAVAQQVHSQASQRQMTLIRAIKMRRGDENQDPFNEFEEDMNSHDSLVINMRAALSALLNLSTSQKNQLRIARKGLFTLLALSSMLGDLVTVYGDMGPERELLDTNSKLLQNLSLEPANRTRFYIAELRGTVRMVEKRIGKDPTLENEMSELSIQSDRMRGHRHGSPDKKLRSLDGARLVRMKGGYEVLTTKGPALSRDSVQRPKVEFDSTLPADDKISTGIMRSRPASRASPGGPGVKYRNLPSVRMNVDSSDGAGGSGDYDDRAGPGRASSMRQSAPSGLGKGGGGENLTGAKARFTDFLASYMPAEERALANFADGDPNASGSDSEDEQQGARDELRISLPSLPQLLRRPMNHLWRSTPDEMMRHGKNRWNPKVLEYREVHEDEAQHMKLGLTARKLLTFHRPEDEATKLFTVSLEVTMPGGGDLTLEAIRMGVSRREAKNGKVPITILNAPQAPELPEDPDMDRLSLTATRNQFLSSTATSAAVRSDALPVKVALDPERPRTLISFDDRLRVASIFDPQRGQKVPKLMMFEHAPGARVYRGLFPSYQLPNGRTAYYYMREGVQYDEEEVHLLPPPPKPSSFPSALQRHMPLASMMDMLAKPPGTGGSVTLLRPLPRVADVPDRHTLPVKNPDVLEPWAFGDLIESPLQFLLVAERVEQRETSTTQEEVEAPRPKTPWRLPDSIFKPRVRESDSKGFFDTHQVEDKSFDREWKRCMGKEKLVSALARENKMNRGKDDQTMLKELQRVMRRHWMLTWSMFSYYASLGADNIFTLSLNDFTSLLEMCNIPDSQSESSKKSDCDTVFIVANFVQDKKAAEAQLSNEHQMMRFEFMEALIRLALNKYGKGQATLDVAEAVEMLFTENIVNKVSPQARHEPNTFRRDRLYVEEVDTLLKKHKQVLQAIYSRFRLPPRGGGVRPKLLKFDHWMVFCDQAGLIDETFALGQAAVTYSWSRMMVIDEVKDFIKFESMTFIDFLEGIGRVADARELPTAEEMQAWGFSNMLEWRMAREQSGSGAYKSMESSWTRPLAVKLEQLLDLIFRKLYYNPSDPSTANDFSMEGLMKKIKKQDHDMGA